MNVMVTCSRCGNHRMISNKKVEYTVEVIKEGWNSFGTALYCPECSKTWKKRNGENRPLAGEKNTFFLIMNKLLSSKEGMKH